MSISVKGQCFIKILGTLYSQALSMSLKMMKLVLNKWRRKGERLVNEQSIISNVLSPEEIWNYETFFHETYSNIIHYLTDFLTINISIYYSTSYYIYIYIRIYPYIFIYTYMYIYVLILSTTSTSSFSWMHEF